MEKWIVGLIDAAGSDPLAVAIAIAVGTLILEDVATIAAAMLAAEGIVPEWVALAALFVGIVIGDLALYGIGRLASSFHATRKWIGKERFERAQKWLNRRVMLSVFAARFLPGMRVPTYAASGALRVSLLRFMAAVLLGALMWTPSLFALVYFVGEAFKHELEFWRWPIAILVLVIVVLIGRRVAKKAVAEVEAQGA